MKPTLAEELTLRRLGHAKVAGLDEAGRGAWAGPVCAAAVVLPLERPDLVDNLDGVRDSKELTPADREALLVLIQESALAIGVGWGSPARIDRCGIVPATRHAMARALAGLAGCADVLLVDYVTLPDIDLPQRSLPKADAHCLSVAAASIVAKVTRDRVMIALDKRLPGYGFAQHKGYGTPRHREAIQRLGPAPVHRMSWQPLRGMACD